MLRFLLRKEFLQIARDRVILQQLFIMPFVLLVVLSSAATFEVRTAKLWVVDDDRSTVSRGTVDRLIASGRFMQAGASMTMEPADEAMLERRTDVIVRFPRDFERDLVRNRRANVQVVLNAEDGQQAGVAGSYVREILAAYSRELGATLLPSSATIDARGDPLPMREQPVIDVRRRGRYNAELQYRHYMIPGILVQLVTLIGTMLTAMNIVREKEAGTLDQLNVTPTARSAFIAAKLLPLWLIALVELSLGLLIARLVFDVPMLGSLAVIYLAAAVYLVAALGVGLYISAVVETQQQAMFITFFLLMIYLLMSGLFTPVRSMPDWAQWMAQLNPLMYFTRLMRAVLLRGATLGDVGRDIVILAGFAAGVLALAVRQYAKRAA